MANDNRAVDITVYNFPDLLAAVVGAQIGVPLTIGVGASFEVTEILPIANAGRDVTIVSVGGTQTLTRAATYTNYLLRVSSNSTLTLADIILDGNKDNVAATTGLLSGIIGSHLILEGTVLQNNNNVSTTVGGALNMLNSGTLSMTGVLIQGNSAASNGGGMTVSSPATITDCVIRDNTAGGDGGGVQFYGTNPLITMTNTFIENNYTEGSGGGIYTSGEPIIVQNGGAVSDNHAAVQGGGVFIDFYISYTQNGGEISRNTAVSYGGGVYVYYTGAYTLAGGTVADNISSSVGGGIFSYGVGLIISDALISGNQGTAGGGIYHYGYATSIITDTEFIGNLAERGGAIYVAAPAALVLSGNTLFTNNVATRADGCHTGDGLGVGGAIFSSPRTATTVNPYVIFSRNYAVYVYNMPLETDLPAYDSVVHEQSSDPQYDYAWNNADINYCPLSDPTMQIVYHRNFDPDDLTEMIYGSNLTEGDAIVMAPPPWNREGLDFAGWSLRPDDTCPTLSDPIKGTFHAADFSAGSPQSLDVYAIWCPEPIYHTVTFNTHRGTPVSSQSILDGAMAAYASTTRAGCLFDGWYTNDKLDVRFNFATPIYEDLTLHAKWICAGISESEEALYAARTAEQRAALAELEALLQALEAGDKCYNIGVLTEYGRQLVTHKGTLHLHNQRVVQKYLAIVPLTIAAVEADIAELKQEELEPGE